MGKRILKKLAGLAAAAALLVVLAAGSVAPAVAGVGSSNSPSRNPQAFTLTSGPAQQVLEVSIASTFWEMVLLLTTFSMP